jgi:hypothetical protein
MQCHDIKSHRLPSGALTLKPHTYALWLNLHVARGEVDAL